MFIVVTRILKGRTPQERTVKCAVNTELVAWAEQTGCGFILVKMAGDLPDVEVVDDEWASLVDKLAGPDHTGVRP